MFYMNQNSNNKSTTCIISHKETGKENQNLVLNIPASKKDKKNISITIIIIYLLERNILWIDIELIF